MDSEYAVSVRAFQMWLKEVKRSRVKMCQFITSAFCYCTFYSIRDSIWAEYSIYVNTFIRYEKIEAAVPAWYPRTEFWGSEYSGNIHYYQTRLSLRND